MSRKSDTKRPQDMKKSRHGSEPRRIFGTLGGRFKDFFTRLSGRDESPDADGSDVDAPTTIFTGSEAEKLAVSQLDHPVIDAAQLKGRGRTMLTLFRHRKRKPLFAIQVILTTVKISAVALLVAAAVLIGAVFGVANAYLESTPDLDLEAISKNDLTSNIYDANGTLITTYAGLENRHYATLEEIPLLLQEAFIATEDVRFYHHNGVDLKGIANAFVNNFTGSGVTGGSTITAQLIKNKLLTSERSYRRKIQEANLAIQLEKKYTKDQILEAYLNTIPMGGTNYGVKAAAMDYFGKELSDLTLREIACLAGITQYPSAYNPRRVYYVKKNTKQLDQRISVVLGNMYKAGYITLDEMNAALGDKLKVLETSSVSALYSYPHFVEYAVDDVITHLLKKRNIEDNAENRANVENELRTKGYDIYLTIDPAIQETAQSTISENASWPDFVEGVENTTTSKNADGTATIIKQPQAACVIIDHTTGQIKAMIGSRDEPIAAKTSNRAVDNEMPVGSSIKPIAVYGPALDLGCAPATIIENIPVKIDGWDSDPGYPTTSQGKPYGPRTIRSGLIKSLNIVAARTLADKVGISNSVDYLLKLGVDEEDINQGIVGLSLGSSGISPLQMAGAYACIANGGVYLEPLSFTKVVDSEGNVILDAEETQESRRVFKQSTAYMLVDMMKQAVSSGTGKNAQIEGMTVAGKTGTVSKNKGVFFAGMTPYYTQTLWIGHDNFESFNKASGSSVAAPLWKSIMEQITSGKADKQIIEGSDADNGVIKAEVCAVSGMLATDACRADEDHPTVTDMFAIGTVPTKKCTWHIEKAVCADSGKIASEYCPQTTISSKSSLLLPDDSIYLKLSNKALKEMFPNLIRNSDICDIHNSQWEKDSAAREKAIRQANAALSEAASLLESGSITDEEKTALQLLVTKLQTLVYSASSTADEINTATKSLNESLSKLTA